MLETWYLRSGATSSYCWGPGMRRSKGIVTQVVLEVRPDSKVMTTQQCAMYATPAEHGPRQAFCWGLGSESRRQVKIGQPEMKVRLLLIPMPTVHTIFTINGFLAIMTKFEPMKTMRTEIAIADGLFIGKK